MTMEMPTGVQVWIPSQDLDSCLELAIKMWCAEEPREVQLFTNQMREKKDTLHRKDGMTEKGMFKEYLEIPITLHKRVMKMTHKDYMLDRKITDRLKYFLQGICPYDKNESRIIV